jgi:multimeric flavodoxin WrbA
MKNIAVIYHSGHGNTEHFARLVLAGAQGVDDTHVSLLKATDLALNPSSLLDHDGYILGSPTYLGGVSGPFKSFMDATGGLWRKQQLKGKLAAGFTVSALPSGDKQSTLISMFTFAMQHGMVWVGNPFLPEQNSGVPYEQAINRLGS